LKDKTDISRNAKVRGLIPINPHTHFIKYNKCEHRLCEMNKDNAISATSNKFMHFFF